ncbi:MAG: hypothetical protein KDB27_16795 [Planctomycetales bacterium]|nr:hypothetical protein [Planctomycetales bacterium]
MLKWVIVVLGLMTGVLLTLPSLVVIGYVLLIIPGLILTAVPTVFVYSLATSLIRMLLPRDLSGATAIAFGLSVGLSAVAMWPWRMFEQSRYNQAARPDIAPADKVSLAGDVLLDWEEPRRPEGEVHCDYLCLALLDTPGVTSVTRRTTDGSATFRRGPNNAGKLVTPHKPQLILEKFALAEPDRGNVGFESRKAAERSLQAEWALRIAAGDELRRCDPIPDDQFNWTISLERQRDKRQPRVDRLEVRDQNGNAVVRKSVVKHFVPARLFYFSFKVGNSLETITQGKFTVGGSTVSNQSPRYDLDGAVELLRCVNIPRPTIRPQIADQLDDAVQDMLGNPNATDAELLLAHMWLAQFQYNATEEQLDVMGKILADDRIADPAERLREAISSNTDLTPLRHGLSKRFLTASDSKSKTWYAAALVGLSAGAFAEPTADEWTIWNQAFAVNEAAPFIERLADQGPVVVPKLMELIDEASTKPWRARWRILRGVREAFKRLGPDAAKAAPRIKSLIVDSPRTLLNSADDRLEWLVALHLMGVAAEDLPHFDKKLSSDQVAAEFKRVENRVQRCRGEQ